MHFQCYLAILCCWTFLCRTRKSICKQVLKCIETVLSNTYRIINLSNYAGSLSFKLQPWHCNCKRERKTYKRRLTEIHLIFHSVFRLEYRHWGGGFVIKSVVLRTAVFDSEAPTHCHRQDPPVKKSSGGASISVQWLYLKPGKSPLDLWLQTIKQVRKREKEMPHKLPKFVMRCARYPWRSHHDLQKSVPWCSTMRKLGVRTGRSPEPPRMETHCKLKCSFCQWLWGRRLGGVKMK